jgi:hypothetical protein
MKKVLYLLSFLLCISINNAQVNKHKEAILSVDNENYNFGIVKQNISIEHIFKITNTGTDTLKIFNLKSS